MYPNWHGKTYRKCFPDVVKLWVTFIDVKVLCLDPRTKKRKKYPAKLYWQNLKAYRKTNEKIAVK